jgi:hypothetical protein
MLGKAMEVVSPARIPANKVVACVKTVQPLRPCAVGDDGKGYLSGISI